MFKKIYKIRNPFIIFAPFLLLYLVLVIISPTLGTYGDESKYLNYAEFLIFGSERPGFSYLGNGPGYPIMLIPFVGFHLPLLSITIMNAVLYYLSVILLFYAVKGFVSFRINLIVCLFWACYINSYENLRFITPEIFTSFLVNLLIFGVVRAFNQEGLKLSYRYIIFSGFVLAFTALTKPIFGYVLLVMVGGSILFWLFNLKNKNYKISTLILISALIFTSPYLIQTYRMTQKVFFWSSLGGDNLYWMSSPLAFEYGSWESSPALLSESDPEVKKKIPGYIDSLKKYHGKDFEILNQFNGLEQDDIFRRMAIDNIKSHPIKFIENCISNVGRILFNYPYSYSVQRPGTLLRFPFSGTLVVFLLLSIYPAITNWKQIAFPIRFLLFFALIYLGGSILGSAETRMLTIAVPVLLLWIAFIISKSVRINTRW